MQQEMDLMELAKLLLQFAVLPKATMDEWLALAAEIKTRYPYPT